jgi:hypothetical protein
VCWAPIGRRAKSAIIAWDAIANRNPINATRTCARGIVILRQSRRGVNSIGREADSGWCHRIAPIGREAESSGRCIIIVVVLEGFVEGRQRRWHVEEDYLIVVTLLGISGGVVYFNHRQVRLIVIRIARGRDIVERDEGVKRPTSRLP